MGGQRVNAFGVHGAVPGAGQFGVDERLLVRQDDGVKRVAPFGVCQKISHTGALQSQP